MPRAYDDHDAPAGEPDGGARRALARLAQEGTVLLPWALSREASAATTTRPAAVLVLFGVLDSVRSRVTPTDPAVSRDLDVLLLARASTLRTHPGEIAFPGGRMEPGDDSVAAAALREAQEETGLDIAGVDVLGTLTEVPLPASGHRVTPVVAWWREPSRVAAVDAAESAAVFRAPVADLLDPRNRVTTVLTRGPRTFRGPAFVLHADGRERLLWGFTAGVLDAMFTRLGWTQDWDSERVLTLT